MDSFLNELQKLINKYSLENGSNTPDFILAFYLRECLDSFNRAVKHRENWYGRDSTPDIKIPARQGEIE